MPVWASHPWGNVPGVPDGYRPFNPRGYHETQPMRDLYYEHVPTEVQHFLISGSINIIARNPYVFVATLIGHAGYHLYEHYAGSHDGASVLDIAEAGGIVHLPGSVDGGDLHHRLVGVAAPRVSSIRGHRGARKFRRCSVKTRRGQQCTLRAGHSSRHRF